MFFIKIANHTLCIKNKYKYTEKLCKNYIVRSKLSAPIISVSDEDIYYESNKGVLSAPDYLESLAIYRKICELLVKNNVILFHCSALSIDGEAVLFIGPSGAGKSTHARLWRERFGSKLITINDDKPLLSFDGKNITVWGTPYGGKDNLQNNVSAKVKGIVVINKSKSNSINRLTKKEALPYLLKQTYRPRDPIDSILVLDMIDILSNIPVYKLDCTISQDAVNLSYNAVYSKSTID